MLDGRVERLGGQNRIGPPAGREELRHRTAGVVPGDRQPVVEFRQVRQPHQLRFRESRRHIDDYVLDQGAHRGVGRQSQSAASVQDAGSGGDGADHQDRGPTGVVQYGSELGLYRRGPSVLNGVQVPLHPVQPDHRPGPGLGEALDDLGAVERIRGMPQPPAGGNPPQRLPATARLARRLGSSGDDHPAATGDSPGHDGLDSLVVFTPDVRNQGRQRLAGPGQDERLPHAQRQRIRLTDRAPVRARS